MISTISRDDAFTLLKEYNKEPFHIQHALTVEAVMDWYAKKLGYEAEAQYWAITGLLHDIDFELYPEQHCKKAPELLKKGGVSDEMIYSICSHGYGICSDAEPKHEMEKVLFAVDELTGLIGAAAKMRPSRSVSDMPEEKIQRQALCGGMFQGCDKRRGREAWLDAGRTDGADHPCNEKL